MKKKGCNVPIEKECGVTVKVDVANIVKYLCIASVLIVAIIFSAKCINKMLTTSENCQHKK